MRNLQWMRRYTCPDSGTPAWQTCFRFAPHIVVTDEWCLLAVRGKLSGSRPGAEMKNATARPYTPMVTKLLGEAVPDDAMVTDLPDLWLWLDHLKLDRCPECEGRSVLDQHDVCLGCDNEGWIFPGHDDPFADVVTILGHHLDRNRLAWWLPGDLADVDSGPVAMWPTTSSKIGAVVFDGGAWRLAIAALDPKVHAGRRYRGYAPSAGLWWHHRGDSVAQMMAPDYFSDRGFPADILEPVAAPGADHAG